MKYFIGIILIMIACPASADDNYIFIEQSGSNLTLKIDQIGNDQEITMLNQNSYFTGNYWNVHLHQQGSRNNTINLHELSGNDNTIRFGQGASLSDSSDTSFYYDGYEYGENSATFELYGNDNTVVGYQVSNDGSGAGNGHTYNLHIAGSDNEVWTEQKHDGTKSIDLTIYNSDNTATIKQRGNNQTHTANVTLDGIYGTNFTLIQNGSTNNSYTISQDCYTVGGCSLSVTQD